MGQIKQSSGIFFEQMMCCQVAKAGFASEESARQAAGRVGFTGEGKWRWLRISSTGKCYVSPVGFMSVKLARANAKNFGYHGMRFNRA
ncbi:hypothetical protein [Piscirickettsia salmonis]|uniref:hypothetical protein n=1 Tax=Piscirickettsia salmonis TaxID=1238 RepID=UPI000AD4977A